MKVTTKRPLPQTTLTAEKKIVVGNENTGAPEQTTVGALAEFFAGGSVVGSYSEAFSNKETVTVTHGMNKEPSVTVTDSNGNQFFTHIAYPDLNTVTASWKGATNGTITCN